MPKKENLVQYARARGLSLFVFENNYSSLVEAFEKMHINDTQWPLSKEATMEFNGNVMDDLYDLFKHIFNFVSSAFSLIDNTRNIIENYASKEFFNMYEEKLGLEIRNEPILIFVKQFRNCLVHKGIPPYNLQQNFVFYELDNCIVGESNKLYFECGPLMDFYEWKGLAKEYIKTRKEKIDFRLVIEEYFQKISLFNRWIDENIGMS